MSVPRNVVKVEFERVSGVPVDLTKSWNSGDMMKWDGTNLVAIPVLASDAGASAAAANFIGVSNDTNPIPSIKQNLPAPRITIITRGIVEFTIDDNATYFPGDLVALGSDPQKVKKTGASAANAVGVVAPENFFGVSAGASIGIVATQGVTKLLIALKPQFTNLVTV